MHGRNIVGSLAALGLCLFVAAPAQAQTGLDLMNAEVQGIWDKLRPAVEARIQQEAANQLPGLQHGSGIVTLEVLGLRSLTPSVQDAMGLTAAQSDQIALRVPLQGVWELEITADVRVRLRLGFFNPTFSLPLTVRIRDLWLATQLNIDDSDPTRPVLQRVDQPTVNFRVELSSSNTLANLLLSLLSPVADGLARRVINDHLNALTPTLDSMQGQPGVEPGANAPHLADSGAATPFQSAVAAVDFKIRQDHLPHGTILQAVMDTPIVADESWLDAYGPGGVGTTGNIVGYSSTGDSAIWTGQYLASQAFRYNTTGQSGALDNMGHALSGIGALLEINGSTGLLARCAAPTNSLTGQRIATQEGNHPTATIRNEAWIGQAGHNGISRDQYSGVFFGLAIAHDLVPAVQPDCALRVRQMLDYITSHGWYVDEDRDPSASSSDTPTFWVGSYQKLAFLLIGERTNPGRYTAELAAAGPLAEVIWVGLWFNTFETADGSYYKYNLSHLGLYNYFRLETDQTRWQQVARGYRFIERHVGNHRNPFFDLIRGTISPSTRTSLHPQVREITRQFLERNHRHKALSVIDLSNVQYETYSVVGANGPATAQRPTEPLHPTKFDPITGDWLWQRSPFRPSAAGSGDPRRELTGLSLVLPYWMGRELGAF